MAGNTASFILGLIANIVGESLLGVPFYKVMIIFLIGFIGGLYVADKEQKKEKSSSQVGKLVS